MAASRWNAPVIGAFIGLTYGAVSQSLDFEMLRNPAVVRHPHPWLLIDTVVSVILPGVAGVLVGLLLNHARWQENMNRVLSAESAKLRRHLITQTLSAHLLHEIRNPIHNIVAVLENRQPPFPPEDAAILQTNLDRLRGITDHLRRWTLLDDDIDLRAPVLLSPWFTDFIVPKTRLQLQRAHVRDHVEIEIRNAGTYPGAVLALQGSAPVESQQGLGLGLVIARRTLELVAGSFSLANDHGHATAILTIPGRAA